MPGNSAWTYDEETATRFVGLLDHFRPVGQAIVDRLPALPAQARVVDLGCGLGEPSLTVVTRFPWVELLGVDTSQDMLAIARTRAVDTDNVRFAVMDMANLDLPADSVDALVSRFAFLDRPSPASVAEFARVARTGAAFSIAVRDWPELSPTADEAGRALQRAGVAELNCEQFTWTTTVEGLDTSRVVPSSCRLFWGHV